MAKGKKGKKGKKDKKPAEKEYKMLTLEEIRAIETKFVNRLLNLRICTNIMEEATMEAEGIQAQNDIIEEWSAYLRCEGLPKPSIPPDIRLFSAKLRFFEDATIEKAIDWLLSVNERSILCQDIFNKDLTRRALVKELRPHIGEEYEKNVHLLLRVLHDIEYFLDDQKLGLTLPPRIIRDIIEQKGAIHEQILQFFDRYSYRILSTEDSFMDSVDTITCEYFYSCDHFNIHIWALKNVPVLFDFIEAPAILAKLHCLKVRLQLPISALQENLSLRAIHYHFDHFSEHAKSFEQAIDHPSDIPSAGITDLYECLVHEWELQQSIQTEVRNKLIERRLEYEEKLRLYNEQQDMLKKAKEPPKKKSKLLKMPKEVPRVGDDEFPEIWEDFLQREWEQYDKFIKSVYHPDVLDLSSDEINMKKYQILGGIYQLTFVVKPTHYKIRSFNMTWHWNNGKLEIDDNVRSRVHNTISRSMSMTSLRRSRMSFSMNRRSMWVLPSLEDDVDNSPYFVLTIELPSHLCLWGDPQPCHFEDDLIGYIDDDAKAATPQPAPPQPPLQQAVHVPDTSGGFRQSIDVRPSTTGATSIGAYSISPPALGGVIARASILNVFRPSLISLSPITKRPGSQLAAAKHLATVYIDDFQLDRALTQSQIRDLQRHCLPRIISSFKFPKELKEDDDEIARNKPKSKGGALIRKRNSGDTPALKEIDVGFTRDRQNNPERIFPSYPHTEPMHLKRVTASSAEAREGEPETFSSLIETLDNIKTEYRIAYQQTLGVPKFKPKVDLHKLRIMQLKKKLKLDEQQNQQVRTSLEEEQTRRGSTSSMVSHKSIRLQEPHKHRSRSQSQRRKSADSKAGTSFKSLDRFDSRRDLRHIQSEVGFDKTEHVIDEDDTAAVEEDTRPTYRYSHWTKKYITNSVFDRKNSRITIWTDRLGTIGLAFKRYEHFPFKSWSLEPNIESAEPEVIFTLDTKYVTCVIFVNAKGYRGYATEQTKKFVRNRAMYLVIEEPLQDLKALKKMFRENNINIFSDQDASFYIEKGYFSEKHLSCELHTYSCMALNSLFIKFKYSQWNRLAQRRDILFHFVMHREPDENMVLVRITPEDGTFVEVKELCSDKVDEIKLDFTLTWRNIDHYSDLYNMIPSMYLNSVDARVKDAKLLINLRHLLSEIRPLSYS